MTCDQRRDLLLLYVSDALEADEAAEMRRHLQSGCPACAGHLAEAEAVMAAVPLGLDPVAPPPHLKTRLMERIAADQAGTMTVTKEIDVPLTDSTPMRLFRYLVPAAVAAGIAIVATHMVMNQRLNELQIQARNLQRDAQLSSVIITSQSQQLELLQTANHSQTKVIELLRSPDLKVVQLQPTDLQPHAVANLLWDKKQQQWAILTDGMTPAAPGETYELWFIPKGGAPVAAGTFDVDANGRGSLRVSIPDGIGTLAQAAVTNEKAGGVPHPAGSAQMAGTVQ